MEHNPVNKARSPYLAAVEIIKSRGLARSQEDVLCDCCNYLLSEVDDSTPIIKYLLGGRIQTHKKAIDALLPSPLDFGNTQVFLLVCHFLNVPPWYLGYEVEKDEAKLARIVINTVYWELEEELKANG